MEVEQHIDFVRLIEASQLDLVRQFEHEPGIAAVHQDSAEKCRQLIGFLKTMDDDLADCAPLDIQRDSTRLSLAWEEIESVPPELLEELSISKSDRAEFNIIALIDGMGGIASIDRLLIALFNQTGEITKRTALTQRLYRMGQKELIFVVPNKKGVYSTRLISDEEAGKRF